jgi:hypothetical protein
MRVLGMRLAVFAAAACFDVSLPAGAQEQPVKPVISSALTGIVIDTLGDPVPFAQIIVVDAGDGTFAGEDGRFRVDGLRSAKTHFAVRRIGFSPVYFDIDLPVAAVVDVRVRLRQIARILPTVEVSDIRAPLRKEGFYSRMAVGHGHFVTPEMIEAIRPMRATDALASIPNVVVDRRGSRTRVVGASQRCEYALIVDKVRVGHPGSRVRTTTPDDAVSGTDIYAIEVYPRNRGLPAHFLGLTDEEGCGTIVIWTKGMLSR